MILFIVIMIITYLLFICRLYIIERNEKTFELFLEINKLCYDYNIRQLEKCDKYNIENYISAYDFCYNKLPSYNQIVFSFKPIKKESFISEEILRKLNS